MFTFFAPTDFVDLSALQLVITGWSTWTGYYDHENRFAIRVYDPPSVSEPENLSVGYRSGAVCTMSDFDQQTLWSTMDGHPTQAPLADRMRPRTLAEFVGQEELIGEGRLLRRAIEADKLQSSIFWGPPGCGKTSLAHIIAGMTGSEFVKLNAVTSGVADVRKVLKDADERRIRLGKATYLLLDECHRWSKAQSDSILPAIESV